jgi:hypothetical protein
VVGWLCVREDDTLAKENVAKVGSIATSIEKDKAIVDAFKALVKRSDKSPEFQVVAIAVANEAINYRARQTRAE